MSRSTKIPLDSVAVGDGPAAGPPGDLAPLIRQVLEVLPLIPLILAGVGDIRMQLSGLRKSHHTVEEVAEATGRAPYTVRTWIKEERIRAIRVPGTGPKGRLLIPHEELEKLVAAGLASRLSAAAVG